MPIGYQGMLFNIKLNAVVDVYNLECMMVPYHEENMGVWNWRLWEY
jgi:hypothetical protein